MHRTASPPQALLRSIFASVRELSVSDNDVNVIVFAFKTGQSVYRVVLHSNINRSPNPPTHHHNNTTSLALT